MDQYAWPVPVEEQPGSGTARPPGVDSLPVKKNPYTRLDILNMLLLAALAFGAGVWIALNVTQRLPHLEDEMAYIFQARVFARGALSAPPPPDTRAFFMPFVLVVNGNWVGKYPVGWPLVLGIGEALGAGWLVNPILAGLTAAAVYALGRDVFDRQVGVLAGVLAAASPFFLILAGTYMSHTAGGLWAALLLWAWRRVEMAREHGQSSRGWAALGGAALGMLALTRPLTAVAIGTPFAVVLAVRLARRPTAWRDLLRTYWPLAAVTLALVLLQPLWLWLTTGSPTTNLYTMVWAYDRIGFGPDIGRFGHTPAEGFSTAWRDLKLWSSDLFGWHELSWIPVTLGLGLGLLGHPPGSRGWVLLLAGVFVSLVLFHVAYWIGASLYGPRYYYEAHAAVAVLAGAGVRETVRLVSNGRSWLAYPLLAGLLGITLGLYLPARLPDWRDVYGITPEPLEALREAAGEENVLIIVEGGRWIQYAPFFAQNSPWLDGDIVAAHAVGPTVNRTIVEMYPDRSVWYYSDGQLNPVLLPRRSGD